MLQCQPHMSVFVNEPKLSDFKQVLMKEGIQAEFSGGVLICNGVVAVRRVSAIQFSADNLVVLCRNYFISYRCVFVLS